MELKKNKLQDYRKKASLSQEKLAEILGVTRQTIISIEHNKYIPSLQLALKLARTFKCKVEDLFGL